MAQRGEPAKAEQMFTICIDSAGRPSDGLDSINPVIPMPSLIHELLHLLLVSNPELLRLLLGSRLDVQWPAGAPVSDARTAEAHLEAHVTLSDSAIIVGEPPSCVFIVEAQRTVDYDKHFSWPAYVAGARSRYRCPAIVVVVTDNPSVEKWASEPIALGGGSTLRPMVVGPASVPMELPESTIRAHPLLGLLSTLVHAARNDVSRSADLTTAALIETPDRFAYRELRVYFDLLANHVSYRVYDMINEHIKREFLDRYEPQTDLGQTLLDIAIESRERELRLVDGRTHLRQAIELRGFEISDLADQSIAECNDPAELNAWFRQLLTATSLDDVFPAVEND